jgi:hypothetical protein
LRVEPEPVVEEEDHVRSGPDALASVDLLAWHGSHDEAVARAAVRDRQQPAYYVVAETRWFGDRTSTLGRMDPDSADVIVQLDELPLYVSQGAVACGPLRVA